jgi:hypothetical protein
MMRYIENFEHFSNNSEPLSGSLEMWTLNQVLDEKKSWNVVNFLDENNEMSACVFVWVFVAIP